MKQIVGMLALLFFVTSCGVFSNDFSGGGIQKRKYTKGFYVNKRGSLKGAKDDVNAQKLEEVASDEASSDENSEGFVNVSNELVSDQVDTQKEAHAQQVTSQTENKAKKKAVVTRPKKETRTSGTSNHRKLREPEYYMPITQKKELVMKAAASSDPIMTVLLVILAIILPPLAVAIFEGITKRFWIDLILFIVGIGVGFWLFGGGIAWLCALVAVIYALLIVLEVI